MSDTGIVVTLDKSAVLDCSSSGMEGVIHINSAVCATENQNQNVRKASTNDSGPKGTGFYMTWNGWDWDIRS
jgi:hypothetical protein